ncbi:MAG: glycosyltransferase family 2 protein [Bacteroidia bacterium]
MSDGIRFSVIIPLFNKEASIERTLKSLQNQRLKPFEVLVVDNGSTDQGPELVRKFVMAGLQLLQQPVKGVSAARNLGIEKAKGEYLCFLDADDSWEPDFLSRIAQLIAEFPDCGWYATNYVFRHGQVDRSPLHPGLENFSYGKLSSYFDLVSRGDMLATASSVCIPAQVFESVVAFPLGETIGEDQDVWARIALKYPVALYNQALAVYYQDAPNMATQQATLGTVWPFILRLYALGEEASPTVKQSLYNYLARQLVGQASQLVVAGRFREARKLLAHELAKREGRRYYYWLLRAYCHI